MWFTVSDLEENPTEMTDLTKRVIYRGRAMIEEIGDITMSKM